VSDRHEFNGKYAAFGQVVEGMEVLEQIAGVATTFNYAGERSLPVDRIGVNVVRLEPRERYQEAIAKLSRMDQDLRLMKALRGHAKDPNAPLAPIPPAPAVADDEEVLLLKTSLGEMSFVLWEAEAPNAVGLVKRLVKRRYYDGTAFHRVVKRFLAQGGCPFSRDPNSRLAGTGGREEGFGVKVEFVNCLPQRGFIALARADGDKESSGSQFFICLDDLPEYQGRYAVFGQLLKGERVLEALDNVELTYGRGGEKSKPVNLVMLMEAQLITAREARIRP
jgi:peptidyl-prolyl cis-trans isomerase B (cyclophilin B)